MRLCIRVLIITFLSAVPALLSYLANSNIAFELLIEMGIIGENVDIQIAQDCCLWIGILFSAIALSLNLIVTKTKYDVVLDQRNLLIKMSKVLMTRVLGQRFLSEPSTFDIRIFIPKHPMMYWLADKMKINCIHRRFMIKNIELIADRGITQNLQFEVEPEQQGLVGLCYREKKMVLDDDLEHTNSQNYNLKQNQIDRTSNLKWSICSPVVNENDKVVAIIALDGKTKLNIDKDKEDSLRESLLAYSFMLYDSVPSLFKR